MMPSALRRRPSVPGKQLVAAAALLVAVVAAVLSVRAPGALSSTLFGGDASGRTLETLPTTGRAAGTGPGLSSPGIDLNVVPRSSGDLAAVELVLAREPITTLTLAVPPLLPDGDGPPARLENLRIIADGGQVPASVSEEAERGGEVALDEPATRIELRYLVVGSVERSAQALPGRVALSLRPVASGAVASSPAVVTVRGVVVHTMVCLDVPAESRLCGVDDSGTWHTENLTTSSSSVLALVDLPRAEPRD